MQAYIIEVVGIAILFATNADNLIDAEEKFIDRYPEYELEKIHIHEIHTVSECGDDVSVF